MKKKCLTLSGARPAQRLDRALKALGRKSASLRVGDQGVGRPRNLGATMNKSEPHQREIEAQQLRKQDAAFAARLRDAIERGDESWQIGVCRKPGNERSICF